ncbi:MAG TPA: heme exporter protein CcmD [Acidimicrobiales bacterium]
MSYATYVFSGYAITAAALAAYAAWVVSRGRKARRQLGDRPPS